MAGLIPKDFIDQLLSRIDIVDVVNSRVTLKKAGREYTACCPFHNEKTPSFTVSPNKQFFHCFGCGAHGSAITFMMEYDHLEYVEAIEALAATLGVEVPRESTDGRRSQPPPKKKTATLYDLNQAACDHFSANLQQSSKAVDYIKQRGLSADIVKQFGIGYSLDEWDRLTQLFGQSFGGQNLLAAGLQVRNDSGRVYDRFRDRLMFPIRDRRGRVIGFGGRVLGDGTPKYLNSPETDVFHKGSELYGLYEARQSTRQLERVLVVEGYMDVVALAQFGLSYAVATLGTATTSQHIQQLFRLVPEVVFCFDGDRAGKAAAWRALETALPELSDERDIRFLFLPDGEDPDTQIRKVGKEAFEGEIAKALPLSRFFILGLKESLGFGAEATLHMAEDSARFSVEASRLLNQMPDILLKRTLLQEIQRLGKAVVGQTISQEVTRNAEPDWRSARQKNLSAGANSGAAVRPGDQEIRKTPVRYAITLLMHSPELAELAVYPEKLLAWDVPGVDLLAKLLEIIEERPNITSAGLFEQFRGTPYEKILLKLMSWQPKDADVQILQQEFQDCFRQIKRQVREKALERLIHKEQTAGLTPQERHDLQSLLHDT